MKIHIFKRLSALIAAFAVVLVGSVNALPQAHADDPPAPTPTTYTLADTGGEFVLNNITTPSGANLKYRGSNGTLYNPTDGTYLGNGPGTYNTIYTVDFGDLSAVKAGDEIVVPVIQVTEDAFFPEEFDTTVRVISVGGIPILKRTTRGNNEIVFTALRDLHGFEGVIVNDELAQAYGFSRWGHPENGLHLFLGNRVEVWILGAQNTTTYKQRPPAYWNDLSVPTIGLYPRQGTLTASQGVQSTGYINEWLRTGTEKWGYDPFVYFACFTSTSNAGIYIDDSLRLNVFSGDYMASADGYLGDPMAASPRMINTEEYRHYTQVDTEITTLEQIYNNLEEHQYAITQVSPNKACLAVNHGLLRGNEYLSMKHGQREITDSATKNLVDRVNNAGFPSGVIHMNYSAYSADTTVDVPVHLVTQTSFGVRGSVVQREVNGVIPARTSVSGDVVGTVIFEPNGGAGTMAQQRAAAGDAAALLQNAFTREGYTFQGWNTEADGSGTPYNDKDYFGFPVGNTTLYAQWAPYVIPVPDPVNPPDKPEGYVTVTFDAGEGGSISSGEAVFYVAPDVAVTLTAPNVNAGTGYSFTGWDKGYENAMFSADTTINAQYTTFDPVIPVPDPDNPPDKPEGYVTVDFAKGDHGSLAGVTKYYVNPTKTVSLTAPTVVADTGWKFTEWDGGYTNRMFTTDVTITAQYEQIDDIVPVPDPVNPPDKPEGYVTVTFEGGEHGTLSGVTVYYVNPTKNVTLTAPTVTAETGWEHTGWSRAFVDVKFTVDTTITASYVRLGDVVPVPDPDNPPDKPEGYKTVTFDGGEHGTLSGTSVFYVNPTKTVSLTAPTVNVETGWTHTGWDKELTQKFSEDAVITAQYVSAADVIPVPDPDNPPDKPTGYVTVTFDKGKHGDLEGTSVFYVNPAATVSLPAPSVTPKYGWLFTEWDKPIENAQFTEDTTVTALYEAENDVVDGSEPDVPKPDGFVTVTFNEGEHGNGMTPAWKFYVNPEVVVSLEAPVVAPDDGWQHIGWDKPYTNVQFTEDTIITALFALAPPFVPGDDPDIPKPGGYVTVTFDKGAHGESLDGHTKWYVNPAVPVSLPAPGVTAEFGWKHAGWDKEYQGVQFTTSTVITALYTVEDDVIPVPDPDDPDNPKPTGYVTVTFKGGEHGTLDGTSVFYVNPTKVVTLEAPSVAVETGWLFKAWDTEYTNVIFDSDTTITAQYENDPNVIPGDDPDTPKPDGYVTVTFAAGEHGTLDGHTKWYVNPEKTVSLSAPSVRAETGWVHTGWDKPFVGVTFTENTIITAQYVAADDVIPVPDPDDPDTPKPDGYVTVTFDKGEFGKELSGTSVFYVNPTKAVSLTAPTVTAESGWLFKEWDKAYTDVTFTADTVITALFENDPNVIPVPDPDDPDNPKPDGYVTVRFDMGEHGLDMGGIRIFYVNPAETVSLDAPTVEVETGWEHTGWDKPFTDVQFTQDTTITALYQRSEVIPGDDPIGPPPAGYVTVTFDKGAHGAVLAGKTKWYVSTSKPVNLEAPSVVAETGWKFTEWDTEFTGVTFTENTTITAQYEPVDDVVDVTPGHEDDPGDDPNKPDGYVTVVFKAGEHGLSLDGKYKFYVNPNKTVSLTAPGVNAETGWKHDGWDKNYAGVKFSEDTIITAQYTAVTDECSVVPDTSELVAIYRMYDGIEHLYVNTTTERDALVGRGWKYEGIAFYTPKTSSSAVHRLFQPATGDHHYTSTPEEIAALTSKHGWRDEGVLFYGDDCQRVELKRLFMPGLGKGEHLHTADPNELEALTSKHGWKLEGVSFYVTKYGE